MDQKGFTLTELIIVVAIIGILAMIAVPAYIGQQKKAARTEAYANLQNLSLLEQQTFAENGTFAGGADLSAIQANLPGFKPGPGLLYSYSITNATNSCLPSPVPLPYNNATASCSISSTPPCFIAVATASAGSRVAGDVFVIDCNNNRNF